MRPRLGVEHFRACGWAGRAARLAAAADVMRARKTVLLALAVAVVAAAVVWLAWDRRPAPVPVLSIAVLGYTNLYDGASGVFVRLKNEGGVTLVFSRLAAAPAVRVAADGYTLTGTPVAGSVQPRSAHYKVETKGNGRVREFKSGSFGVVLSPGASVGCSVSVPEYAPSWRLCASVRVSGVRTRAAEKLTAWGWPYRRRLTPVYIWTLNLLADNDGPMVELESDPIEVGSATNGLPRTYPLQPADDAPGR